MGSYLFKQNNNNNNEEQQNHILNEQEEEELKYIQECLLEKGYNYAKLIQKNRLRDIILVYQYFNHEYNENIIISINSQQQSIKQIKCYFESSQNNQPYTYSSYISEHFSNEDETIYFIVLNSSLLSLNIINYFNDWKLNDILILNQQLLKIIENLINNNIYNYPLDIYSIGYNRKKEQLALIDGLFIFIFQDQQNQIKQESENQENVLNTDTEKNKQKATQDYLNRIGIIILQIFFGKYMNEEELINMGKSKFKIKEYKLMDKYLQNIFWKYIINEKNEETNISTLISEINEIQSQLFQNLQLLFTHKLKRMFSQPKKPFIDLWNHQIYLNQTIGLSYHSQIKHNLNKDIPSQIIHRSSYELQNNNNNNNNINGTIIYFKYREKNNIKDDDDIKLNCQPIVFNEFEKKCSQIQRLDLSLSFPQFPSYQLINIFRSIRDCTCLTSLEIKLSDYRITAETIEELMLSLQKLVKLRKLNLELSCRELKIENKKPIIMKGLKNCKLLADVRLQLKTNYINSSSDFYLFSLFQYIPLSYLELKINSYQLDTTFFLNIGKKLKKCSSLKELTLMFTGMEEKSDDILIMFGNKIKQCPSLLKLELNFINCRNTENVKLEFCKNLSTHTLINTIKIHFSNNLNYEMNPKSSVLENPFKKKNNFINICVKN